MRRGPQIVHNTRWINGKIEEDKKTEGNERRDERKKGKDAGGRKKKRVRGKKV